MRVSDLGHQLEENWSRRSGADPDLSPVWQSTRPQTAEVTILLTYSRAWRCSECRTRRQRSACQQHGWRHEQSYLVRRYASCGWPRERRGEDPKETESDVGEHARLEAES